MGLAAERRRAGAAAQEQAASSAKNRSSSSSFCVSSLAPTTVIIRTPSGLFFNHLETVYRCTNFTVGRWGISWVAGDSNLKPGFGLEVF